MLHVRPITDGIAHLFPFAFIFPNRLLAFVNKRKHAVTLDLLLAVQSEQLFHFKFNGKSVRIPTRFAQHVKAFHRAVAGNDILHGAGQNMPDMRPAVSCGRSVIESVSRFALGLFNGFLEDAVCLPEFQNLFLSRNKVERGGNFFVHCSNTPFLLRKFLKIKTAPKNGTIETAVPPGFKGITKTVPLHSCPLTRGLRRRIIPHCRTYSA